MTTRIYSHPSCLQHDPGEGHPENPGRLENVLTGLKQLEYLEWLEAGQASDEQPHFTGKKFNFPFTRL